MISEAAVMVIERALVGAIVDATTSPDFPKQPGYWPVLTPDVRPSKAMRRLVKITMQQGYDVRGQGRAPLSNAPRQGVLTS